MFPFGRQFHYYLQINALFRWMIVHQSAFDCPSSDSKKVKANSFFTKFSHDSTWLSNIALQPCNVSNSNLPIPTYSSTLESWS